MMLLPLFLLSLTLVSGSLLPAEIFPLPTIDYEGLLSLKEDVVDSLVHHLSTIGTVQISNIPTFPAIREQSLSGSADCLKAEQTSEKRVMVDGSIRYSSGAKSIEGIPSRMDNRCGDKVSQLRSLIDAVCRQLFVALDKRLESDSSLIMAPTYRRFSDLMGKGSHLEHLHSYFPSDSADAKSERQVEMTMDFHTDSGLMIAMTTGYFSNGPPSPESGLYLTIADDSFGERKVKAGLDDNCLVIMMGEGAKNWLRPVLGRAFRPVPHALLVNFQPNVPNSRAWFGKMYLPPSDAILPIEGVTFSQQRQIESDYQSSRYFLPLACGGSFSSQVILQNQPCEEDGVPGVYCWTQVRSFKSSFLPRVITLSLI